MRKARSDERPHCQSGMRFNRRPQQTRIHELARSDSIKVRGAHFAAMTLKNGKRAVVADTLKVVPKGPGPENQFIQLRPTLHGRETDVLKAVAALPAEIRTPKAAATELVRRGIGIPYSSLGAILRRLERKGALRLGRVKS